MYAFFPLLNKEFTKSISSDRSGKIRAILFPIHRPGTAGSLVRNWVDGMVRYDPVRSSKRMYILYHDSWSEARKIMRLRLHHANLCTLVWLAWWKTLYLQKEKKSTNQTVMIDLWRYIINHHPVRSRLWSGWWSYMVTPKGGQVYAAGASKHLLKDEISTCNCWRKFS